MSVTITASKIKKHSPSLTALNFFEWVKYSNSGNYFLITVSPSTLGDGFNCVDKNECLEAPCDVNAVCENTPGRYQCTCKDGYSGKYKFSKTEITEIVVQARLKSSIFFQSRNPLL